MRGWEHFSVTQNMARLSATTVSFLGFETVCGTLLSLTKTVI